MPYNLTHIDDEEDEELEEPEEADEEEDEGSPAGGRFECPKQMLKL